MTFSDVIRGKTTVKRLGPGKIILAARTFRRRFRRALDNLGKQAELVDAPRVLIARCCAPKASQPGQTMGVYIFQGHYLDTVLQNEARDAVMNAGPPAPSRPIESAADEAAAEEEAEERT